MMMISQRQRHPASSYIGNSQHYLFIIVSDCDNNNLRYMLQCNSLLPTYYNAHNYHKSKYMAFLLFGSTLTNSFSSNYVLLLEKLARVVCIMVLLWYANHSECRWISQPTRTITSSTSV